MTQLNFTPRELPLTASVFGKDSDKAEQYLQSSAALLEAIMNALGLDRNAVEDEQWKRALSLLAESHMATMLNAWGQVGALRASEPSTDDSTSQDTDDQEQTDGS